MRSALFVATISISMMTAGRASAQEPVEQADRRDSRPRVQVLQDPYDLASFYRSGGAGYGTAAQLARRYPIASYYRGEAATRSYGRAPAWGSADSAGGIADGARWERRGRWQLRHSGRVKPPVSDDGEEP